MTPAIKNLTIVKGKTFAPVLRWAQPTYSYAAISAITRAAPTRITAASHGVPDGWLVAVVSVPSTGMRQINAKYDPPRGADFHKATRIDANTVDLNDVNSALYSAYTSGGYLQWYTPYTLTGYTARMYVRTSEEATGDALIELTTENGGITLNNTTKTITLLVTAAATAALDFLSGVYDLEMIASTGEVSGILKGSITVEGEVTRADT